MNFRTQSGRLNNILPIYAVYEDVLSVSFTNLNRDNTASDLTTATMNIALKGTDSILQTVTGTVVDNVASFSIDTAELPQSADYIYQVIVDGDYTLATGKIDLSPLIK